MLTETKTNNDNPSRRAAERITLLITTRISFGVDTPDKRLIRTCLMKNLTPEVEKIILQEVFGPEALKAATDQALLNWLQIFCDALSDLSRLMKNMPALPTQENT